MFEQRLARLEPQFQPLAGVIGRHRSGGKESVVYMGAWFAAERIVEPVDRSRPALGFKWRVHAKCSDEESLELDGVCKEGRKFAEEVADLYLSKLVLEKAERMQLAATGALVRTDNMAPTFANKIRIKFWRFKARARAFLAETLARVRATFSRPTRALLNAPDGGDAHENATRVAASIALEPRPATCKTAGNVPAPEPERPVVFAPWQHTLIGEHKTGSPELVAPPTPPAVVPYDVGTMIALEQIATPAPAPTHHTAPTHPTHHAPAYVGETHHAPAHTPTHVHHDPAPAPSHSHTFDMPSFSHHGGH